MITFALIVGLFFVVLFSAILEILIRYPLLVGGIVLLISLITFALATGLLSILFIIWIIIYTLAALITAFITEHFLRQHHRNDNCF